MTTAISNLVNFLKISRFSTIFVRISPGPHFAKKALGWTSLGFALARCDGKVVKENATSEPLTREYCIKQACLMTVNSASTLLTTTSSAILDICNEYKNSLNTMLFLLEQVQLLEGDNPELWDAVVEARASLNKAKAALNELNSYMESVEKVVNSTTEAAFMGGTEYMCSALCERLYSAQKEISNQISELKKLEEDYLKLQQEIASNKDKNLDKKKTKVLEKSVDKEQLLKH